jgi:ribosomal protein S25
LEKAKSDKKGKDKGKSKDIDESKSKVKRTTLDPEISDNALHKELDQMGAITPYSVASKFDLKLSTAKSLLKKHEEKGLIERIGGNNRLSIYKKKD